TLVSQPLTIGATINSQIAGPGDEKKYTFTGVVGQRIFYDSLQSDFDSGQQAQLITPSGGTLFDTNQDSNNGPYTLPEAGTYQVLMTGKGDATGTFSFRIIEPTLVSQPLTIGATMNSQIAGPGDEKKYTFTGVVGQRIFCDSLQS